MIGVKLVGIPVKHTQTRQEKNVRAEALKVLKFRTSETRTLKCTHRFQKIKRHVRIWSRHFWRATCSCETNLTSKREAMYPPYIQTLRKWRQKYFFDFSLPVIYEAWCAVLCVRTCMIKWAAYWTLKSTLKRKWWFFTLTSMNWRHKLSGALYPLAHFPTV